MVNQNNINKFFLFLVSTFNILTPTFYEFKIFGLETSYEFLIYFIWILYSAIESIYLNRIKISINFAISVSLIAFIIFFEFFIKNNFKAVYEVNFIFLLFSLYKFQQIKDFNFLKKLIFLNLILFISLLLFTNVSFSNETQWDYRLVGDEYLKRKSLYGYVSISLSIMIIFSIILIIELLKKKVFNKILLFIFLILLIYFLILTFSRTGVILLVIYFVYNLLFDKKRKYIFFSFLFFILIFYFFTNLNFNNYFELFSNLSQNIRIKIWRSEIINYFDSDILNLLLGDMFFKNAVDNTYLSILIGKGLIGFGIYFYFIRSLYQMLINHKNQYQIRVIKLLFILLIISFNFMEFFGQRKIIFLFSLYLSFIISLYDQKNNHS